jgi:DNA-binding response OmpR family regulator
MEGKFTRHIIDDQLPGVSGMGLCEEIRQPDDVVTPSIVFFTLSPSPS